MFPFRTLDEVTVLYLFQNETNDCSEFVNALIRASTVFLVYLFIAAGTMAHEY